MNTNARLKSKAMPYPQKVMSVVKSPRLEPRRTKRTGLEAKIPAALKTPGVIVTLSPNARGCENSAAPRDPLLQEQRSV
jgi:hypothetical protein